MPRVLMLMLALLLLISVVSPATAEEISPRARAKASAPSSGLMPGLLGEWSGDYVFKATKWTNRVRFTFTSVEGNHAKGIFRFTVNGRCGEQWCNRDIPFEAIETSSGDKVLVRSEDRKMSYILWREGVVLKGETGGGGNTEFTMTRNP
jgi:hypothetical protein